nr:hypothetical protein [Tanacetum cinerariifolium]
METSNNPYNVPVLNQDQPSFNHNYMQQPMPNPKDITDLTTAINMALALMAKAFKLNYTTPTNNNQRISSNPRNRQIAQPDLDEIEKVNANCILMANLQQASTSGTQTDKALVYDADGSAEYTELFEPIPEPLQVPQNDNNLIYEVTSMEQSGRTVEQHPANVEETRALYGSLYHNLATKVEKVNTVNRKLKETNAELTTELARYKNQEKCFGISQEKYDKLERCYQKSVYQEQCLSKKINALHLSSEASKFVGDFKSLAKEANKSLAKHKALELEIERLLKAVVSQDIMFVVQNNFVVDTSNLQTELEQANKSLAKHKALELEIERLLKAVVSQDIMFVVQNNYVVDTSNLQTELERTKERLENCIIKKENEYAKLWNDWYKKCEECKFDKISYDKAYNDMQRKIERLQAQLGDLTGVDNTKTRRPQPRSNTKNDRVPSASNNSCNKNKGVEVEEHHRNLLLSKNKKHMSSACNNVKLATQNVKSKVVCAMCKQCLISINHDVCLLNNVNGKTSRGIVCFRNDHVAAILGFSDLQWGNILITSVYFVEGLDHNLFSEIAQQTFTPSTFMIWPLHLQFASWLALLLPSHGYGINLLSHLNFDTINDLAKHDLVSGLPKFKYHKELLCPSCEKGKIKRASHLPKPVPNSKQRLHLLHMDLCGPMRIASINRKRYVLVIVDDYSRYTWEQFLRSKDEAPENDCKNIRKLGAKGDIFFFIGYSADSCAYRIYNRRTRKIIETMNVSFDELLAMAFEQCSSKPRLQSELDLLFEAMYDDYIGGQPLAAQRTVLDAQAQQVRQTSTTSTSIADTAQQQGIQASLQPKTVADNIPNAMLDANSFTIDHPLEQVIGEPSRPLLIRNQLQSDGGMCIYALTVSTMEPKNLKEAMTDPAWIESMQEELLLFKRIDVWVNQLRSDGDMCMHALTVSTMEPKNVKEAMTDPAWIESMQEELLQFKRLDV